MRMVIPLGSLTLLATLGFTVTVYAQEPPPKARAGVVDAPTAAPALAAERAPDVVADGGLAPKPAVGSRSQKPAAATSGVPVSGTSGDSDASGAAGTEESSATGQSDAAGESAVATTPEPEPRAEGAANARDASAEAAPEVAGASGKVTTSSSQSLPLPAPPVAVPAVRRAVPADHPFALYLNLESHWNNDPGYDVFSSDDTTGRFGLGVSYDLIDVAPSTTIVPEFGFLRENSDNGTAYAGEIRSAELGVWDLLGAVSVRYRHFSWLGVHARAQLGASAMTVAVSDQESTRFEDSAWAPFAGLGAGVDIERSVGARVSFGLIVEGGYVAAIAPKYELDPESAADDAAIPIREASLGELSRSGAYLRFAGLMRF